MSSRHLAIALTALAAVSSSASAQSKAQSKAKSTAATSSSSASAAHLHYVVAPTGNEARYRVREQLAGVDLPSDAIGKTTDVTGMLVVDPSGTVVKDSSKITIGVKTMKSDKSRRDNYLKTHTLETDKFPTVTFVPSSFQGLTGKPGATPSTFDVLGDLTLHGTTHPVTWHVSAKTDGNDVAGTATTAFTFKDMGLDQPKVPIVLSVEDTIKLEYDFRFTPKP
jgi:polyisoprenoid-binding protein YceI